jgi:hypothetical protein
MATTQRPSTKSPISIRQDKNEATGRAIKYLGECTVRGVPNAAVASVSTLKGILGLYGLPSDAGGATQKITDFFEELKRQGLIDYFKGNPQNEPIEFAFRLTIKGRNKVRQLFNEEIANGFATIAKRFKTSSLSRLDFLARVLRNFECEVS